MGGKLIRVQIVLGGFLYRGQFVSEDFVLGGFLTSGLWLSGFCSGLFWGAFDWIPYSSNIKIFRYLQPFIQKGN